MKWIIDKNIVETILIECQITGFQLPHVIDINNVKQTKKIMLDIYNMIYKLTKLQETQLTEERIKFHINQRCVDYDQDPSKMIDSILSKHKRKIVID